MKLLFICCATLLPAGFLMAEETPAKNISVEQLEKTGIVGRLGLPLGELTGMEGEIVAEESTGVKSDEGLLLLKVTSVSGKLQPHPQLFRFTSPGEEKPSVGTRLKFRGYETGGFTGLPKNWPEDVPRHAGVGFHFESRIVILAIP
ncbi:MAG: hypothetical protein EOP88_25625 [Verrucomicrobiaceae bacterium]|nr:MAG: hypothetical protein EOP88_25625 [Verrucomicrobiaceae bacterium]